MSDIGLGKIITTEQQRDAIHVAVAPVTAAERLYPAQPIGLMDGSDRATANGPHIGIVDPFLTSPVFDGQRFWLWLFPNTVTGMRHHWQHPAFGGPEPPPSHDPLEKEKAASRAWLEDFAKVFDGEDSYDGTVRFGYDDLMALLGRASRDDSEYFLCHGFDTPDRAYIDRSEMWRHYEIVTGDRLTEAQKQHTPFRCSC